ncbi:MAG: type III-A CRISPR-associated protein Cas10/Csm1 [Desulfosoma sp.]
MAYSMKEVVVGALLHDVGKPLQRGFTSIREACGVDLNLESTLCPSCRGRYSHKHVLFTSAFMDWMEKEGLTFGGSLNLQHVDNIASYHHRPDSSPEPAASWLCAVADRLSAGMDRRPDEAEEGGGSDSTRDAYKKTPLSCIFDEVVLGEKNLDKPTRHAYRLVPLDPEDDTALLPIPWTPNGLMDDLPQRYRDVCLGFKEDFKRTALLYPRRISFRLLEEMILGLLERYFWAVPSSTIDCPDISLYDHSRTTAAIAACLYRFHEIRGNLNDERAIRDEKEKKFRFLSGDLSGIQKTLFTLQAQGVRGVNKILRARSFAMGALVEAGALRVLEALDLPYCCVLQKAGGRFLALVADVPDLESKVDELRREIDAWLLDKYTGSLALNLALSDPFAAEDFKPWNLNRIFHELAVKIEEAKFRPLATVPHGVLKREYPEDRACSACGVRPAVVEEDLVWRCPTCHMEFQIGRKLVQGKYVAWGRGLPKSLQPFRILDLDLAVSSDGPDEENAVPFLSVQKIVGDPGEIPWCRRTLANHVPVFKNSGELKDPRFERLEEEEDGSAERLGVKTFQHIAALSLELDPDGRLMGRRYLGLLKADVDYLGFIFSSGFRRKDEAKDRLSISRVAQLSRMLDLYFTGYLKGLLHREFPDTYTVYAGGDDLLMIGPWRQTMALTHRIYETFREYTGRNPSITLSAGLTLIKPNYPVNRGVWEAESFLETAKEEGRNKVCAILPRPIPWDRYAQRLQDAQWIHEQLVESALVSTGFLHKLFDIIKDAEAFMENGDLRKANWRAHLAYHLSRNIRAQDAKAKQQILLAWLTHLGLDDQLRFTTEHSNLYDWRLPLTIALYRQRTA